MNDKLQQDIALACQRLIAAFAYHVDHRGADGAANVFAQDGTFERRGDVLQGREAIRASIQKRPAHVLTRHLCSPPHVEVIDAHNARAVTPFTLYRGEQQADAPNPIPVVPVPELVGEYEDSFQLTPEGWRIKARRAIVIFMCREDAR